MSNGLDLDQDRYYVRPDLDPTADDTSRYSKELNKTCHIPPYSLHVMYSFIHLI